MHGYGRKLPNQAAIILLIASRIVSNPQGPAHRVESMELYGHAVFLLLILALFRGNLAYNATLGWQTLHKSAPIIIANGGSSGIYPDQTYTAYADAANSSALPLALLCDLQLTKDSQGICRTGWNLADSTNVTNLNPSSYNIRGEAVHGYFSVDYTQTQLLVNTTAIQSVTSRSPLFDGLDYLSTPENVSVSLSQAPPGTPLYLWVNVEVQPFGPYGSPRVSVIEQKYPTFYQQHPGRNSLASYLTTFLGSHRPSFLSATEVGILRLLRNTAAKSKTSLIFKVLQSDLVEESTNTTYGELLQNLTNIATFATGILIRKELIFPVDNNTNYVQSPTNLVQAAHKANLEVFVYRFANDDYPSSFNYSYDPVREYVDYIGNTFNVDGFLTDFPTSASEAINCYPEGYQLPTSLLKAALSTGGAVKQPLVISHNGASGDFPGSTKLAYSHAIADGADYIDCTVQITRDGVPVCRDDPDLLKSTNILSDQILYQDYLTTYSELQAAQGVFIFDISWANISTLRASMYSPYSVNYSVFRNRGYDGKESIISLDEFLTLAKGNPIVGVYIDLQNSYYLRTQHNLDTVDAVVSSLTKANMTNASDKVFVASEDSSALAALQHLLPGIKLVYKVKHENPISVTLPVLQEINKYASIVALDHQLIDPVDEYTHTFLATKTSVVDTARSLNMTVFYHSLANEYVAYAADYRSDPMLQINSLIENFKIEGFITDFPATLHAFLHKNQCYRRMGRSAVKSSTLNFPIFPVVAGDMISRYGFQTESIAPSPALAVSEPTISYLVPAGAPTESSATQPSAATRLSTNVCAPMMLMMCIILFLSRTKLQAID